MPVTHPFALDTENIPVFIQDADPARRYHCACGATMVHKGQKQLRQRAAHFAHPTTGKTRCESHDRTFHDGVVNMIAQGFRKRQQARQSYLISIPCMACETPSFIPIGRPFHSVQVEAHNAAAPGTRADLLFTLTDGIHHSSPPDADRLVIEIVHTHAPTPVTTGKYNASKVPIIYVRIGPGTLYPPDQPDRIATLLYGVVADHIQNLEWHCANIQCGKTSHLGLSADKHPTLDSELAERLYQQRWTNRFAEFNAMREAVGKLALDAQAANIASCPLCAEPLNDAAQENSHMVCHHGFTAAHLVNDINVTRSWRRIADPPTHDSGKWWADQNEIIA